MKKIIGVVILVLIIASVVFYKYFTDSKKQKTIDAINYASKPQQLSVTGFSGYTLDTVTIDGEKIPVIRIPLVTWGGYAALFAANNGIQPNKESLFYKNGKFVVELVRDEDPNSHLSNYAKGKYPIIWSTVDTMPLLYDVFKNDKRVIPQVFGIFDWSYGGDGIIAREYIKTPKDLKGKRIVVAGNTPSNFFLLWVLAQSNLTPSDVMIQYVSDAITAKDAYLNDTKVDACVTWSPFLYEITDPTAKTYVAGSRLLITSRDANQLISDCYLARLDFTKDHPEIIEAFSKSMMEGADLLEQNKQKVFNAMAELFKLPGGAHEASLMLEDVHIANFPENMMIFDSENPISAFKIFFLAQEYYKNAGSLPDTASYDAEAVINITALKKFQSKKMFASQQNTVKTSFNKQGNFSIADLESKRTVLTEDIQLHFDAAQVDFNINSPRDEIVQNRKHLSKIAEQMNVLGTTVVKLIGHLDTTKVEEFKAQGQQIFIEASAQAKLISKKRAEFIKKILVEQYQCDEQRIFTEGKGWDQPIDPNDQTKNRRVEVKFLSFE